MAFVFRSQQNKEKPIKTEDILHTNEKIEKEFIQNKHSRNNKSYIINPNLKLNQNLNLAFSSSASKGPSYLYPEHNPGPGSYGPSKNDDDGSNINEDNMNNNIFISREKRFKDNEYETDWPGPGRYYKDIITSQKKNIFPQKELGILYKKSKKYLINDSKRKVTIPSKGTNFGYSMDKEGDLLLKKDPQKKNKFNGTHKNSVGPGYYFVEKYYSKKNNAHDWNKDKDKDKSNESSNNISEKEEEEVNNDKSNEIVVNDNNTKEVNKIIVKADNLLNRLSFLNSLNEDRTIKIKQNKFKENRTPGPGNYYLYDEFDKIAKNKKNQNFGSSKNRGLLFSIYNNLIKVGRPKNKDICQSLRISTEGNNNKNIYIRNKNNVKLLKLSKTKELNEIKDNYINNKNDLNSKRGPGMYSPSLDFYKKSNFNEVQNFGSLSRRFDTKDYPFNSIVSESEEVNYPKKSYHFQSQIPKVILRRNIHGLSYSNIENNKENLFKERRRMPPVGLYSPEQKFSIEYDIKNMKKYNEKSPGFGEGEKRFYEKENNDNVQLGAGYYNIIPKDKKFTQRKAPFIFSLEKNGIGSMIDINLINKNSVAPGPGSYDINEKNEWKKKSFNKLFS